MKNYLILLLFLASICQAEPNAEVTAAYYHEDVCWTTNKDGCDMEGVRIAIKLPLRKLSDNIYFKAQGFYMQSLEEKVASGKPAVVSHGGIIGAGAEVDFASYLNTSLRAAIEASYITQSDAENLRGNENFNDGYEIRAILEQALIDQLAIGLEYAHQEYQNCSADYCHGLKDLKPVMKNIVGEIFAKYKINQRLNVKIKYAEILAIEEQYHNGRSPHAQSVILEVGVIF